MMGKRLTAVFLVFCVLAAFGPVTLAADFVPVTNITGVPSKLNIGDRVYATVTPANATYRTVVWGVDPWSNSIGAQFVEGNKLTATSPGTVTITATVIDNDGNPISDKFSYIVNVNYVPVTHLLNVPTHAVPGRDLPLTATVVPDNAVKKTIRWALADRGVTDAVVNDNRLFATVPGVARVRAVIDDGIAPGVAYVNEYEIHIRNNTVDKITGVPTRAPVNRELPLTGTVIPSDANQTIIWSLFEDGTTADATVNGDVLLAKSVGKVMVKATVPNGKFDGVNYYDYEEFFTIFAEFASVTSIIGVPSRAVVNQVLHLAGTVVPSNATNQAITWSIADDGKTGVTLTGNSLLAKSPGVIRVRATVVNGSGDPGPNNIPPGQHYMQDFEITVTAGVLYETAVTVSNNAFGTAAASPRESLQGETVFLNAKPQLGYYFQYWQVVSGNIVIRDIYAPDTYFTMPNGNVSVRAVFTQEQSATFYNRYTVLVLDVSDSSRGTPFATTQQAARQFCQTVLAAGANNRVAVVSYSATVRTECEFTSDITTLRNAIDRMTLGSNGTDMYGGLDRADALLSQIQTTSAVTKNIVLMADGLPDGRQIQNSGRYTSANHRSYQYCNAVYDLAWRIRGKGYWIYTVGFYHPTVLSTQMSASDVSFARDFMRDLQNTGYYDVSDPNNLTAEFTQIANHLVGVFSNVTFLSTSPAGTSPSGTTPAGSAGSPSPWAAAEVRLAISSGLVPAELQAQYTSPLTRAEFCALAVKLYESVTASTLPANPNRFIDTGDIYVQKMANVLYIDDAGNSKFAIEGDGKPKNINGVSGWAFDPGGLLAREQAAHLMANLASAVRKQSLPAFTASFADINNAGAWARASIGKMCVAGIMTGTGNNNFSPKKIYTREEGIIAMLHLYQYL